MKIKCDYCGSMVDDSARVCPNCGAPFEGSHRVAGGAPKTIEELKAWYAHANLPPEEITRFFIGKDIKDPKAFGIYRDNAGDYVVYKNKSDGSRAVRYQGSDEAYAVNELYQRLKAEIVDQKSRQAPKASPGRRKKSGTDASTIIGIAIFLFVFGGYIFANISDKSPSNGYYRYKGNDYYYQDSSWYMYDPDYGEWGRASDASVLDDLINKDTQSEYRTYDHPDDEFEDSYWYDDNDDDDDGWSWDSDNSWSSDDSWDSGGGDWDSDW